MSDLKKQAEELGIDVDGRWSDETLQEKIDEALADDSDGGSAASEPTTNPDAKPKTEKLIPVRINRDFWDAEGKRHRKGAVTEVSVDEALDGVESGALSRVKG